MMTLHEVEEKNINAYKKGKTWKIGGKNAKMMAQLFASLFPSLPFSDLFDAVHRSIPILSCL